MENQILINEILHNIFNTIYQNHSQQKEKKDTHYKKIDIYQKKIKKKLKNTTNTFECFIQSNNTFENIKTTQAKHNYIKQHFPINLHTILIKHCRKFKSHQDILDFITINDESSLSHSPPSS
jgi:hypothetical protein